MHSNPVVTLSGAKGPMSGFLQRLRRIRMTTGATLKRICGMPDYPGYLQHMAERHPGCPVLSERQFYDEQVMARYGNGASRCC
jgi:uncharacterized short protein YbdD (DUF466 family)